ncbi:MAG: ribonuclease P protein component [bacterium]
MFPREKRVSREDFPKLLASRTRLFSPHFSATLSETSAGVAAVVSKKVEKTSVGRHRLKRRILGVLASYNTLPALGIIVFAKAGAAALSSKELREELRELFRKV